jgi:hypothetical protein
LPADRGRAYQGVFDAMPMIMLRHAIFLPAVLSRSTYMPSMAAFNSGTLLSNILR